MHELIFWLSLILLFYIYLGYPFLLSLVAMAAGKPVRKSSFSNTDYPHVTVLIAAYNEAAVIKETILNKLSSDYPEDKLDVVVISDESSDGTDDEIAKISSNRVRLIRQTPRSGKTSAINLAVEKFELTESTDLLLFSDANSIYSADAIRNIAVNFSDSEIGYVTGNMVYVNNDGEPSESGNSFYMKYENYLREKESLLGSVVGVDGGIDVMRAELFEKLNPDQLPDFVQPLKVFEKGYRVIYEPSAVLRETDLDKTSKEFKMRQRVSLRAFWALHDMRHLLNPLKYSIYSWQLLSHKLLRYLAGIPMFTAYISNLFLTAGSALFAVFFSIQCLFYILAIYGYMAKKQDVRLPWFITMPYSLTLLNLAALIAFLRYLKGDKIIIWKPRLG